MHTLRNVSSDIRKNVSDSRPDLYVGLRTVQEAIDAALRQESFRYARKTEPLPTRIKTLFDTNPIVDQIFDFRSKYFTYLFLLNKNGTYRLEIYDKPLSEITKQLDAVNIKYTVGAGDGKINIDNVDPSTHYVLNLLLLYLPTWKQIWDLREDIDWLVYFLENNPEFVQDYIQRHLDEFPRLVELVQQEPAYDEIIIAEGVRYLDWAKKEDDKKGIVEVAPIVAEKMIAKGTTSESQQIEILNLLLSSSQEDPKAQHLLNSFYTHVIGLPMRTLNFDIKADGATLVRLGKLLKK